MKILFWNIGDEIETTKFDVVKKVIASNTPDIVCIAEGSYSRNDCRNLNSFFDSINYFCYYSPLFADDISYKLDYKFGTGLGLKLYIKDKTSLVEDFHYGMQREEGRIISMIVRKNEKNYALVFLHNHSKKGDREINHRQTSFITRLSDMIKFWYPKEKYQTLMILGDFNLEPWDTVLREKKLINNFFLRKHWNLAKRNGDSKNNYFNPILENIILEQNENLGGTFFKNEYGWALLDYVLINGEVDNIGFSIITDELLEPDVSLKTDYIKNKFDHLPILTEIKN